jgi:hypothetical protein
VLAVDHRDRIRAAGAVLTENVGEAQAAWVGDRVHGLIVSRR